MPMYCWTFIRNIVAHPHHHIRHVGHRLLGYRSHQAVFHSVGPPQAATQPQTLCIYTGAPSNRLTTQPEGAVGRKIGGSLSAPGLAGTGVGGTIGSALIKAAAIAAVGSTVAAVGVASFVTVTAIQGPSSPIAVVVSSFAQSTPPNGVAFTSGQPVTIPEPTSFAVLAVSLVALVVLIPHKTRAFHLQPRNSLRSNSGWRRTRLRTVGPCREAAGLCRGRGIAGLVEREQSRETRSPARGTEGSNPSLSSEESGANLPCGDQLLHTPLPPIADNARRADRMSRNAPPLPNRRCGRLAS